jgi:hypothetical protein
VAVLRARFPGVPEVEHFASFVERSKQGVARPRAWQKPQ